MPIIFRRYRKSRNGHVIDAHDYGYAAWPIKVRAIVKKHPAKKAPTTLKGKRK